MKVLFKNAIDRTLFFAEVSYVCCDSDGSNLYFYDQFEDEIVIQGLSMSECKDVIRQFFYKDRVDLTCYDAFTEDCVGGDADD